MLFWKRSSENLLSKMSFKKIYLNPCVQGNKKQRMCSIIRPGTAKVKFSGKRKKFVFF